MARSARGRKSRTTLQDKIESTRSGIGLRSDQPLSRTQMGVSVAETLGMKTGAAGHSDLEATSTGNEARFSSTKPRSRPASPREGIAAVGDLGASVAVAAARSPMGLPTCLSCRCNLAAPDAADQLRRRRRQRSAMNAIANGNPPESSATRPAQRARRAWWNARPAWRETAHRTIGEGTTPTPRTHGA